MPKILFLAFLPLSLLKAQSDTISDSTLHLKTLTLSYAAARLSPINFQNWDAADFRSKSTGQEPSFLLSETPSISVYSDAGSTQGYSYFRMRGIDQTRINMSLDGVPLNEPEDQGAYFSNYPDIFNSLSSIQIQRGVGSSKNGVANYGGSIQLFSASLSDSMNTSLGLDYGAFGTWRAFAAYNSGIQNRKALCARASAIHSDGYKYDAANNSASVFLSSAWFGDQSSWKLNVLSGQQRNELAWLGVSEAEIAKDRRSNANENEKDRFRQTLLQIQNHWTFASKTSLQSSLYYTHLNGNYDFDLNNFLGLPSTEELYNYAFLSHLTGFFSNFSYTRRNFNWTTGLHANHYSRQHRGSEKTLGRLYQNKGFKNEASLFSKAEYRFRHMAFLADLQYRYARFDYQGSVELPRMDWNFFNPKLGGSYALSPESMLYYSIGRTGREPTRNDLFGGNDDLLADSLGEALVSIKSPEYVTDQELGFRHQGDRLALSFNLFYLDFNNEIVLDGKFGPNGLALTNKVERSFRTGLEWTLNWQITPAFALNQQGAYNYSRILEQRERFSPILTPPLMITQEFVYTHKGFLMAFSGRYQDASYMDFANTASLDAYFLFNARAQYRFRHFQLGIFGNNLGNARYFNNGYVDYDGSNKYFVQAPRNASVSLQYVF